VTYLCTDINTAYQW